jgi:hypothetical protein
MSHISELFKHIDVVAADGSEPVNDCNYCRGMGERLQTYCPVCRNTGVHPTKVQALVMSNGKGGGGVLEHNGSMYYDLEESGLHELSDLGLDEAPEGLSVFEGRYTGGGYDSYNGDYHDAYLEGDFRELTRQEWDAIIEKKRLF